MIFTSDNIQLPDLPKTKKELMARVISILGNEYEILPVCKDGTGAAGVMLELLLGSQGSNKSIADSAGTEIKFSRTTALVTLFHKDAQGGVDALSPFVYKYGKLNKAGLVSFRHTISNSPVLRTVLQDGQVKVRAKDKNTDLEMFWEENTLMATAGKKLNDLVLVFGSVRKDGGKRFVKFKSAKRLTDFKIKDFLNAVASGYVLVDIDARQNELGKKNLRNHGTKFRVKLDDVGEIWNSVVNILPVA